MTVTIQRTAVAPPSGWVTVAARPTHTAISAPARPLGQLAEARDYCRHALGCTGRSATGSACHAA